jgi:phosphotransferase system  glucose/maltose/N-acetylglucosamine-specific IIC component
MRDNSQNRTASDSANHGADQEGYVAVSLDARETVSGKSLMVSAYGIIFSLLIFYIFSLLIREKRIETEARKLEKRLKINK